MYYLKDMQCCARNPGLLYVYEDKEFAHLPSENRLQGFDAADLINPNAKVVIPFFVAPRFQI